MPAQVVTANRLGDGRVVYLTAGHGWSEDVRESAVSRVEDEGERLLAVAREAARDAVIVDPYLIDVDDAGGPPRPIRLREQIRASGPTIHPELCRFGAGR